ncbi:MAG: hypothetical protein QNK05_06950 [Myxococcota bacterium]|nr:hypothetical protein [Myxococcota bacterium]
MSATSEGWRSRARAWLLAAALPLLWVVGASAADDLSLPEEPSELESLPERPRPILELGSGYLEAEPIPLGFRLPGGAVWQPQLLVWGTLRSALQAETGGDVDRAEWATRFDLFGQLSLTPTERLVIGIEPFQDGTDFTGYRFGVDGEEASWVSGLEVDVDSLFFEGDLGELIPRLDRDEWWPLDLGFMVGRVPVVLQDGFLIDDRMTGFGLVQNSILATGSSNLRVSLLAAFRGVNRGRGESGADSRLVALSSELDRSEATWSLDLVYVDGASGTDGFFGGLSGIGRFLGRWNWTARLLGSTGVGGSSDEVGDGVLGVLGLSVAPRRTHDVAYLNLVGSVGEFTAASRSPDRGGPLARIGILFEAPGVGSIGSPFSNDADHLIGAALGYQKFFQGGRRQVVLELGARSRYDAGDGDALGMGLRFQQALGRRFILRVDGYGGTRSGHGGFAGGRAEIVLKL